MYFPFLRGKRHELSALRKLAIKVNSNKIKPIIEPVKANTSALYLTIKELNNNQITPLIIVNPLIGEKENSNSIDFFNELSNENFSFIPCVAYSHQNSTAANQLATYFMNNNQAFSTYFKDQPSTLMPNITLKSAVNIVRITPNTPSNFFVNLPRQVRLNDSFESQSRNADYPTGQYHFSDTINTHIQQPNTIGFGDYQMVGEPYSEKGGPARAVAIHITFIDSPSNSITIKHCVSTSNSGTTTYTAQKFLEALDQLILFANQNPQLDQSTTGFQEFVDLHARRHFPNLGPVKENSMMHHIETITNYL
ncbi:sce7725 family protein [Psychromonas sp. Urea-02u-13]|uniref:sce7725 family protein n=1 Tax=Psychromonas sp. Urea-02u-13 TaxID=2058326 RepID=UPI000C34B285|nr:sce7725 family protein [Psychromonas sp. Urea-02u-13]PKG40363.1 ATP-binding protein [Psychromonas sp. Urea-02u-13]